MATFTSVEQKYIFFILMLNVHMGNHGHQYGRLQIKATWDSSHHTGHGHHLHNAADATVSVTLMLSGWAPWSEKYPEIKCLEVTRLLSKIIDTCAHFDKKNVHRQKRRNKNTNRSSRVFLSWSSSMCCFFCQNVQKNQPAHVPNLDITEATEGHVFSKNHLHRHTTCHMERQRRS